MKITKLVLATDFSEQAQKATEYAKALKDQLDAELIILHVFDEDLLKASAPYFSIPKTDDWLGDCIDKSKKRGLNTLDDLCQKLGSKCGQVFVEGNPAKEIIKYTENNQVDLLIMGTHGYSGIKRLFMGSVAAYVLANVKCPVVTIKAIEEQS